MSSTKDDRILLSGNEAIARGAWEHGVRVATAYPGTPSTEILEAIAKYDGIYAQWSPNEKVALEVAIGASVVGGRAMASMKHVGVNVAADPLLTLAYTGVNAGLVLVSADDPGIHSSQNEQDNRFYGRFARIPVIEPSDSQECKDFMGAALHMSEDQDTVVILRSTTRISHSKSLVTVSSREERPLLPYSKDILKYVMVPGNALRRQPEVLSRHARIEAYVETSPLNRIEWGDRRIGVITAGIAYQYVKDAYPDVSVLKLGITYPLPVNLIREFAKGVETVVVIEELEPFLYENVLLTGVEAVHSGLPRVGELSAAKVQKALARLLGEEPEPVLTVPAKVPMRPPVMCPGCPHRSVFYVLQKMELMVSGDIGCYTLGALPPLSALDIFMSMGASIGMALGMEKADPASASRTVAVIGDSTFLHSGVTGLMDMVYNKSRGTVIILDNGTVAMTGHQDHPATGVTAQGEETRITAIEDVAAGVGVRRITVLDPFDIKNLEKVLREELKAEEVSVIIARSPCVLTEPSDAEPLMVSADVCKGCKLCARIGCPAISWMDDHPVIDQSLCGGCSLCANLCPFDAISVDFPTVEE
ncbi:MAG TPA: indolepyruvate ferredoxin oxidoreductase subunit alpha [Armatimonadota bacterium]|nr:indolepyruvate ferredoxin oxidoreductase subunit alpha [Armatimonadota bacterium]